MTDNSPAPTSLRSPVSRRCFLESTLLAAGSTALPRLFEGAASAAQPAPLQGFHPLDPLSKAEIESAAKILGDAKKLGDGFRFISASLAEPIKAEVRSYEPGQPSSRQALVVLNDRATGTGHEAIIDLQKQTIVSLKRLPAGVQPSISIDEGIECEEAIRKSPLFLAHLQKRGIKDASLVMADAWSAGSYGNETPDEQGRRLVRALCFVRSEAEDNGYARPLDLVVIVDLNKMEVIRVDDNSVTIVPPESSNWARQYITSVRSDLKPLEIVQRDGPSFTVDGYEVRWQKWKFRLGFTPREGLVLHTVSYDDDGRQRPILHRASICEMVVPYGDPGNLYYRKNAFDIGEYLLGASANSLTLGCDCLGTIRYFDVETIDSRGKAVSIKNAICLHEEDAGLLWKHTDWRNNQSEVRRSRRLTTSLIATAGNYEYGFFWHFYQDGTLQCEVKLTGIMSAAVLPPGAKPTFGVEIAPQLQAPLHQHLFCARLDMNIDGDQNSVYEVNTVSMPRDRDNPHGNAFRAQETLLATEQQAQRSVNSTSSRFWRIVNPNRKNRLGHPVGYRLLPGENCPPFVQPDASVALRAGFVAHNLWVTPYLPHELHAAGDYPNQHSGGDGLPKWTKANRPIENTDLVLWYVFAHNHVPRVEDWPVMPASSLGFMLKPDGFFERNPALDLPPPSG